MHHNLNHSVCCGVHVIGRLDLSPKISILLLHSFNKHYLQLLKIIMKSQHIAIIGAGTAGLALARILARQGHHICMLEKANKMENVGAGLLLQPSGIAVFEHLGVLDDALALGAPVSGLEGRLADGSLLVNSHYKEVAAGCFGLGMHRASLCHVLMQGLNQYSIEWQMGMDVQQVQPLNQKMRVKGITQHQAAFEADYDAVIIANGARSEIRPASWVKFDQLYPWGAAWCIVPACNTLDAEILHQFYDGPQTMMGILPTGSIPGQPEQKLSSVFWSLPQASIQPWLQQSQQREAWLESINQRWPKAAEWLSGVISNQQDQWLPANYRDVVLSRYGEGRLGIIGDAAHAMSPQLGQGVNMALLDAWALGQAIHQAQDWSSVWQNYHQSRLSSIRFYQWLSRTLTPFYQSNRRDLGWLRDVGFTWMYRIPWLRQQMARTISGVKLNALQEVDLKHIATPLSSKPIFNTGIISES